jgi:ABC-type spermidine/putrescine transport system permease subunit II
MLILRPRLRHRSMAMCLAAEYQDASRWRCMFKIIFPKLVLNESISSDTLPFGLRRRQEVEIL